MTKFKTVRDVWDFAFDGLAGGGDRDTMTRSLEKEIDLDAPLVKAKREAKKRTSDCAKCRALLKKHGGRA